MNENSMLKFQCFICKNILNDPIECTKCNKNFCRNHLKQKNCCPVCKQSSTTFPVNLWLKNAISNTEFYSCSLCIKLIGEENDFLFHLIQSHKKEVIDHFKIKNKPINKSINKLIAIVQKIPDKEKAKINNNSITQNKKSKLNNNKTIKPIDYANNKQIKKNNTIIEQNLVIKFYNENIPNKAPMKRFDTDSNISSHNKEKIEIKSEQKETTKGTENQSLFESCIPKEVKKEIIFCGKKNEKIKCDCCPDHICKKGNCLCVNCMQININDLKFQN